MNVSLEEFKQFSLITLDGYEVSFKDFIYDPEDWELKYLVGEISYRLKKRIVYIPKLFWSNINWEKKQLLLLIGKTDLELSLPVIGNSKSIEECEIPLLAFYRKLTHLNSFTNKPVNSLLIDFDKNVSAAYQKKHKLHDLKRKNIITKNWTFGRIKDLILDSVRWKVSFSLVDYCENVSGKRKMVVPTSKLLRKSLNQFAIN